MVIEILAMPGPRASFPADYANHPLRAALARGDRMLALSGITLEHLLAIEDRALLSDAVVAQVGAMLSDMAGRLAAAFGHEAKPGLAIAIRDRLSRNEVLRGHCQSLACEWRLALQCEDQLGLDPVLSPVFESLIGNSDPSIAPLGMAALAAQSRFAQASRRMQLPVEELPGEIFHAALSAARAELEPDDPAAQRGENRLRASYDESATRLALLARLAATVDLRALRMLSLEEAGVAMWLSALALSSGEDRDRTACAAADPSLGRLLLTLRAAGVTSSEAERQALAIHPDCELPRGLQDLGTREAAAWLGETGA